MRDRVAHRALAVAEHTIENKTTIRRTAELFGVSKSTVHKDLTERLPLLNQKFYKQAAKVLGHNLAVRHIRGGEATRRMWLNTKGELVKL